MKNNLNYECAGTSTILSSPVLKWVGGKTQLLPVLNANYPKELKDGLIETYIEPFVGGGAVYFDIANKYQFKQAYLFDVNPELVLLYNALKYDVEFVINELKVIQEEYLGLDTEEKRKDYFYNIRKLYNSEYALEHKAIHHSPFNFKRAAKTIFLNRTCFNGLFRVNSKGLFNVPHGKYKNPTILFTDKLRAASQALQKAIIQLGDFSECENYVTDKTFIYYDPPYRPLSQTSDFTAYSKEPFDDAEQIRLAGLIKSLDKKGIKQLLSNSDPTNYVQDPFFDDLYADFTINRVSAKRMINSNSSGRGELREILVRNY